MDYFSLIYSNTLQTKLTFPPTNFNRDSYQCCGNWKKKKPLGLLISMNNYQLNTQVQCLLGHMKSKYMNISKAKFEKKVMKNDNRGYQ